MILLNRLGRRKESDTIVSFLKLNSPLSQEIEALVPAHAKQMSKMDGHTRKLTSQCVKLIPDENHVSKSSHSNIQRPEASKQKAIEAPPALITDPESR